MLGPGRWAKLSLLAVGIASVAVLSLNNLYLGLVLAVALAIEYFIGLLSRDEDDGMDIDVVEEGEKLMLVVRSRYGANICTNDRGFLILNARGDRRRVKLGYKPIIVGKRFQNGVTVLYCRKPAHT